MGDEYRKLTPAQRVLLIEEIWDSLCEESDNLPVTAAQREELDRRLEDYALETLVPPGKRFALTCEQ